MSEQSGSGYPGGVPGALSNQPAPANNAPISTPPANQNNRQQQASTTSNSGPRSTQRNDAVTTHDRHNQNERGRCATSVSRGCGELQNLARWQTVASQQRTDEAN
ncbi:hypothetical protein ACLB1E_19295 [Escherichia coli]